MVSERSVSTSAPVRVLVAEDVALNRELMRLFLEPHGYDIDMVRDGIEAVEAIRRCDYDIVFMDMQMPAMDGLEATRAVRALGGRYLDLPIIALSANVVPQQVRMCLDAGMTAHLGKPFTEEDLIAAIERWGRPTELAENSVLKSFVAQVGWAAVRGLLDMMLKQIVEFDACSVEDLKALGHQAHAMRGAASALGYGDLAQVCRQLELSCKADNAPSALIDLARQATRLTRLEIEHELAKAA